MSLHSMTGYGHGESRSGALHASVDLSSVNRKQLDLHMQFPKSLQALEARVEKLLSPLLVRGRITVHVEVTHAPGATRRVRLNEDLARAYIETVRKASRKFNLCGDMTVQSLLELPDVLVVEHPEEQADCVWPVLEHALKQAAQKLVHMRRTEGRELARDLLGRLKAIEVMLDRIAERAPGAVQRYREGLSARLRDAGLNGGEHADRIAREVAVFADRCDIAEEITRLRSHFKQARTLIRNDGAAGRTLDFLAQEMLREINTIGSKSVDAAIASVVVEFKAELERFREQVQNVE